MKPLYDALYEYAGKAAAVFHMPGHKLGRGFIPQDAFRNPALIDATELDETDDLHSPRGPLRDAQELAAKAFGAGRTWFLVNGSSCGIFAMIAANCSAGKKLLIARDFHYSAFNAMRFARARPIYIPVAHPERGKRALDPESVECALDIESVERAFKAHPDAAAVYITRPGYYGSVCDIAEISRIAHSYGARVLVDEAHGAHLAFSRRLPVSALEGGADFCVQSAHKTLPAFTQCAYAHASPGAMSADAACVRRFSEALRVFQTSSPSFMLTASLDYAREYMSEFGGRELDRITGNCERFYARMAQAGYGIPGGIHDGVAGRFGRDITRLVLDTRLLGLSGTEAERLLWSRHRIKIEMADPSHIVMIATVADSDEDFDLLTGALLDVGSGFHARSHESAVDSARTLNASIAVFANIAETQASTAPAAPDFIIDLHRPVNRIPLAMAEGRTAAEIVAPYPPGISLLCPGELITAGMLDEIRMLLEEGIIIRGIEC